MLNLAASKSLAPLAFALALALAACSKKTPEPVGTPAPSVASSRATAAASAAKDEPVALAARYPAPKRLVAIGDLHGDLDATRRALKLAGAIDDADKWIGGELVVVQTGDDIDRGDDDRAILDLFDRLRDEAKAKGGMFLVLNGNHELMNVSLDFRYVTPGSKRAFDDLATPRRPEVPAVPEDERGRANAFAPAGPYAKRLAERPLVAIVGDSVFVHGGVLMKHVSYGLDRMDGEVRAWLRGDGSPPAAVLSDDGPVWTRLYSAQPGKRECDELSRVLARLGAKRMVMGHTPQRPDITSACESQAWRIDTGMSKHYGGRVEALEIVGDTVRVLKEAR
jgi:hypothetical protein